MSTENILQFDGSEIISDVMLALPEAAEILESHGFGCAGCHFNVSENLKDGIMSHGMDEDAVKRVLQDLNEAAEDLGIQKDTLQSKPPELSEKAAQHIRTLQQENDCENCGLKIDILEQEGEEVSYFLDFLKEPERGDRIIESYGIQLFLAPDSLGYLKNKTVDYVDEGEKVGFEIV